MKLRVFLCLFFLAIHFFIAAQVVHEIDAALPPYIINARQYGAKSPETFVTLQNRNGLRIEYCVDRAMLTLWISPQAWKSMSYVDRNWSSRDDHTDVYSRIRFDNLDMGEFLGCDYDAFHSVIKYKNQKIHLLNIYDTPAVVVWFEEPNGKIDFKSHRFDQILSNSEKEFINRHSEAGRQFDFASILGKGASKFVSQRDFDTLRSVYSSARMHPNEVIVIGSELKHENISEKLRKIANTDIKTLLADNQKKIDDALQFGKIKLRNNPELQKVLDVNLPIALSMQDGGALRSCSQYIYYLIWIRDGGMNSSSLGLSGWLNPAHDQSAYALLNPSVSSTKPFEGKYFGQLLAGNINKWEEDGIYYAVWPMFSYWSYSGIDKFQKGAYIQNIKEATKWLENYCYSKEKQLFGRYYYCEAMFYNSQDYGFDNAVGYQTDMPAYTFGKDTVLQSYDIYINSLMYSTYLMLSASLSGKDAEEYYNKAMILENGIKKLYTDQSPLPNYGEYKLLNGKYAMDKAYGADITDYQWGITLPFFQPNIPDKLRNARNALMSDILKRKKDYFICAVGSILYSMDTEIHSQDSIMKVLEMIVQKSKPAGKYLPMAYTIPEMTESPDGDPFHDIRPIVYSIGPTVGAVANLAFRRLPFGIAPRSNKYIEKLEKIQYMDKLVSLYFEGDGPIASIDCGGKILKHSFQLPDRMLQNANNRVVIKMDSKAKNENMLIGSTVRLFEISESEAVIYDIQGYGQNILMFKNLSKKIEILNDKNEKIKYTTQKMDQITYIEFSGKGNFKVRMK